MPKYFLPSSLISHWKTTCLFHKNEADQAFFVPTIIVLSFSFWFSFRTAVQILNLIFWMKVRTTTVFWPQFGGQPTSFLFSFSLSYVRLYETIRFLKRVKIQAFSLCFILSLFSQDTQRCQKKRTRFNWRVSAKGGVKTKCEVVQGYQTWTSARVSSKRDRVQKGGVKT